MSRKSNTEQMFEFIKEYLDGNMERMFFDLDFGHYLIKYYPAMERQDPDMAGCFAYYLAERGADISSALPMSSTKASFVASGKCLWMPGAIGEVVYNGHFDAYGTARKTKGIAQRL